MTCQIAIDDQPQLSVEEYLNQELAITNTLSLRNFEMIKSIGSGGFGTVSLVKQIGGQFEKYVALKKIFIGKNLSEQKKLRFMRETNILQHLNHQSIIKMHDYFIECEYNKKEQTDNNSLPSWYLCITMDYASNGDLSQLIERHKQEKSPIQEDVIWNICKQVTLGLQYLHQKKIIHRDIKPQNILITTYNQYKIADMGISRNLNSSNSQLHTSKIGTPLYQAPEIIRKQPYDYKIDMWALGCLLHYLAAQEHPFQVQQQTRDPSPIKGNQGIVNSRGQLEYQILNHTPKNIPEIYSTKLQLLIQRLLDKSKDNRPNSEDVLKLIPSNTQVLHTLNGNLSQSNFYQATQVNQKRHSAAINRSANVSKVGEHYPINQKHQQDNLKPSAEKKDERQVKSNNTSQIADVDQQGTNTFQIQETKATDADHNTAQNTQQQNQYNIKMSNFSKTFYKASELINTPDKKSIPMFTGSKKQISHTPGKQNYAQFSIINPRDEQEIAQVSDFYLKANRSLNKFPIQTYNNSYLNLNGQKQNQNMLLSSNNSTIKIQYYQQTYNNANTLRKQILESQHHKSKSPDITQGISLKKEIQQVYESQRTADQAIQHELAKNYANMSTLDERQKEFEQYQLRQSQNSSQLKQKIRYNSNYPTQRIYGPNMPHLTNNQQVKPVQIQNKNFFAQNQSLTQFSLLNNNQQSIKITGTKYSQSIQQELPETQKQIQSDQKVAVQIYDPLLSHDIYDFQQTLQVSKESKLTHQTPNINSKKVDSLLHNQKGFHENHYQVALKHHHRKVVASGSQSVDRYSVNNQQQNHAQISNTLKQHSVQQQIQSSQLPKINKNLFLKTNFRNQRLTVRDLAQ